MPESINNEKKDLNELRKEINAVDNEILSALAKRFILIDEIGDYKAKNNMPMVDKSREKLIYDKLTEKSEELGINPDMVCKTWELIIEEAVRKHEEKI